MTRCNDALPADAPDDRSQPNPAARTTWSAACEPEGRIELPTYSLRVKPDPTQCHTRVHAGHEPAGHDAVQPNESLSPQQHCRTAEPAPGFTTRRTEIDSADDADADTADALVDSSSRPGTYHESEPDRRGGLDNGPDRDRLTITTQRSAVIDIDYHSSKRHPSLEEANRSPAAQLHLHQGDCRTNGVTGLAASSLVAGSWV